MPFNDDGAADERRIPAIDGLPHMMADDDYRVGGSPVIVCRKHPPAQRTDPECREIISRDVLRTKRSCRGLARLPANA